jgi:hypothetical protein
MIQRDVHKCKKNALMFLFNRKEATMEDKKEFVTDLNDKKGYQRLIPGVPITFGMKSGRVYLEPGQDSGIHSTENKEEQLVFLQGEEQRKSKPINLRLMPAMSAISLHKQNTTYSTLAVNRLSISSVLLPSYRGTVRL